MNTQEIKPAYENFSISKLLKEKGFDVKTRGRIHVSHFHLVENNIIPDNVNTNHYEMFAPIENWNAKTHYMSLPEQWQVVEWLRVKYGIHVFYLFEIETKKYSWEIWDDKKEQNHVHNSDSSKWKYNTPQEAYSAAFDYILNNLI